MNTEGLRDERECMMGNSCGQERNRGSRVEVDHDRWWRVDKS